MKNKMVTRTLFDALNQDALDHLLSYLAPAEAWALAKTNQSLHQRITRSRYWRSQGQLYFPFLRNWYRLAPPKDVTVFELFTLAYQQHIKSKTAEQRQLIELITRNQLEYSSENLKLLRKHFQLKEEHHKIKIGEGRIRRQAKEECGPSRKFPPEEMIEKKQNEYKKSEFSVLSRYHLWQWFMESQCSWQETKCYGTNAYKNDDRILIFEGKIDKFLKKINNYKYGKFRSANYFIPQLLDLLRLGYTDCLDQIIDFATKHKFLYELMFSFLKNCPHLSPLEYCLQYQDYDAFVLCYQTMWHLNAAHILRPNTLIMMLQSTDSRFLEFILSNTEQQNSLDKLMSYMSGLEERIAGGHVTNDRLDIIYQCTWEYDPFQNCGLFFKEMRQQLYNLFAASIRICYEADDKKTAKLLLEKILAKSTQLAPGLKNKKYSFDATMKKTDLDEYFKSGLTLDQDDVYRTVMAMQPTKKQKQFIRKTWAKLGGLKQTEGFWPFFFGVALLVIAILLVCAIAALLLMPNVTLLINQLMTPIAVSLIGQLTLTMIVSATAAILSVLSAGFGLYLLKKSDLLYNTTLDELPRESIVKMGTDALPEPKALWWFLPHKWVSRGALDPNSEDWLKKTELPLFFANKLSKGEEGCRGCHTPSRPFPDRMNFNFIV